MLAMLRPFLLASLLFAAACSAAHAEVAAPGYPGPRTALAVAPAKIRAPYDVQILRDSGETAPTYAHRGRFYIAGNAGERYIVLGAGLAYALDTRIGDEITVLVPVGGKEGEGVRHIRDIRDIGGIRDIRGIREWSTSWPSQSADMISLGAPETIGFCIPRRPRCP